jgi:hypothetical protein
VMGRPSIASWTSFRSEPRWTLGPISKPTSCPPYAIWLPLMDSHRSRSGLSGCCPKSGRGRSGEADGTAVAPAIVSPRPRLSVPPVTVGPLTVVRLIAGYRAGTSIGAQRGGAQHQANQRAGSFRPSCGKTGICEDVGPSIRQPLRWRPEPGGDVVSAIIPTAGMMLRCGI